MDNVQKRKQLDKITRRLNRIVVYVKRHIVDGNLHAPIQPNNVWIQLIKQHKIVVERTDVTLPKPVDTPGRHIGQIKIRGTTLPLNIQVIPKFPKKDEMRQIKENVEKSLGLTVSPNTGAATSSSSSGVEKVKASIAAAPVPR